MTKALLEAETARSVNRGRLRFLTMQPGMYWRSLLLLNWYRVGMVIVLLCIDWLLGRRGESFQLSHLYNMALPYLGFAGLSFIAIHLRKPIFEAQLAIYVIVDVAYLVAFMAIQGGVSSGFGVLLIPYLAAVSLLSRGRMTLFHAAVAVLAVLGEEVWRFLSGGGAAADFVRAGLLCGGYFATAWLARSLARYAVESQKLAEERGADLANLAQLNQLVIQTMPDGVLVVDGSGRVRQANQQVERLLGPSRVREEAVLADFHPELPRILAQWHEAPERDTALLTSVLARQVRVRLTAVHLNRQDGVLLLLEDAGREQQEAQQIKLAALGRLTASIAHEIRNPLAAISHASEILLEDVPDASSQKLLRIIGDNVFRIEKIVQDVLALNRRDRAAQEPLLLAETLGQIVQEWMVVDGVPASGYVFNAPADCMVLFDRGHLHQVVWNLLSNAWRHSRQQNGSVRVTVSAEQFEIRLEIQDDGPGVPDALSARLFEPFFTTASQGNGLGLYIAQEICAANNARLAFAGNWPGALFRVTFRRMDDNL